MYLPMIVVSTNPLVTDLYVLSKFSKRYLIRLSQSSLYFIGKCRYKSIVLLLDVSTVIVADE